MLSYSTYTQNIKAPNTSNSQQSPCHVDDLYKYERQRLGHLIVSQSGEKYGPYLYRNLRNNVLVASWDKPSESRKAVSVGSLGTFENRETYSSSDIGLNADALVYYKNE